MAQTVKNLSECRRPGFDPWVGKISWRRERLPIQFSGWRIPWTEEPGRLQSMGSQRVGHDRATFTSLSSKKNSYIKVNSKKCLHTRNRF